MSFSAGDGPWVPERSALVKVDGAERVEEDRGGARGVGAPRDGGAGLEHAGQDGDRDPQGAPARDAAKAAPGRIGAKPEAQEKALTGLARRIAQTAARLDREIARLGLPPKPGLPGKLRVAFRQRGPRPMRERFEEKVVRDPLGCDLWIGAHETSGYGSFRAKADENSKRAHRVAWEIERGPVPDGLLVLHSCDVKACVKVAHLFLGTHQDNSDDKWRKGRANPWRILDDATVREIVRAALAKESTEAALAKKYGIAHAYVSHFVRGVRRPELTADLRAGAPDLRYGPRPPDNLTLAHNRGAA